MNAKLKAALAVSGVGLGLGVGYVLYKRSERLGLFAQFRKLGDVNGDGVIDYKDDRLFGRAYGSTPGTPNWNPACDLNGDGIVDSLDQAIFTQNYGLTYQQWLKTKGYAKNYTVQTTIVPIKEI